MTPIRAIVVAAVGAACFCSGGRVHEWAPRIGLLADARVTRATTPDPWAVRPFLPAYHPMPVVLRVADPARVQIPAIGVDAGVVSLGLLPDGTMDVPKDFGTAGWYRRGPRPGENGPAVIAGHVDSTTGPAVFLRLATLRRGDIVHVPRVDGKRSTFVVTRVARFDKERFPTADVFGPTVEPELRLVTCGGDFDFAHHSYRANVVVFASLIGNN